jgi:hypothetical protein
MMANYPGYAPWELEHMMQHQLHEQERRHKYEIRRLLEQQSHPQMMNPYMNMGLYMVAEKPASKADKTKPKNDNLLLLLEDCK